MKAFYKAYTLSQDHLAKYLHYVELVGHKIWNMNILLIFSDTKFRIIYDHLVPVSSKFLWIQESFERLFLFPCIPAVVIIRNCVHKSFTLFLFLNINENVKFVFCSSILYIVQNSLANLREKTKYTAPHIEHGLIQHEIGYNAEKVWTPNFFFSEMAWQACLACIFQEKTAYFGWNIARWVHFFITFIPDILQRSANICKLWFENRHLNPNYIYTPTRQTIRRVYGCDCMFCLHISMKIYTFCSQ